VTSVAASPDGLDLAAQPSPPDDWDDLLAASPLAEYTQAGPWLAAAAAHLPGVAARFWTVRRAGRLVGGLAAAVRARAGLIPRGRQESSLAGPSGGPVVAADLPPAEQDRVCAVLVDAFGGNLRGGLDACVLVLSPGAEERFGAVVAGRPGWTRRDTDTAAVSLAGGFAVVEMERVGKNKRNERNRGLRRGLEVRITRDPELLAAYYPLHEAASGVWGRAPTPLAFLQAVLADPRDRTFFSCALLDGRVVGGHLCLHLGARVLAWHGVTDPAVSRSHFPATVLVCADLEEACRRGAAWLDLGGSGDRGTLEGFKRFFGAEMQTRGLYRRETAGLRLLRAGSRWRDRLRVGRRAARWHDAGAREEGP